MRIRLIMILCMAMLLCVPFSSVNALPSMGGWGPIQIAAIGRWFALDANADATRVVFLYPYTTSGTGNDADYTYDRQVIVSEFVNGAWSVPVTIANNAMYRPDGWMPVTTRPVISADGSTVAYLGCTGGCKPYNGQTDRYDIYISMRGPSGWSPPVVVPTIPDEISERLSLSADGSVLAFGSILSNLIQNHFDLVYVVERHDGVWGMPVAIPTDRIYGGYDPVLARDGQQVIWANGLPGGVRGIVTSSRQSGGGWSPQQTIIAEELTTRITHFRYSADGSAIFYWKVIGCTSQELMVLHRSGAGWGAPQKVNGTVMTPKKCDGEAPAAVNAAGTRVIYPHSIVVGDILTSDFLNMVEFKNGVWTTPTAITTPSYTYYSFSLLSDDGYRLVSLGPDTTGRDHGAVVWMNASRQMFLPLMVK